VRPFTECNAAVVLTDCCATVWGGLYGGAVYDVAVGKSYSPRRGGFLTLTLEEDRDGGAGVVGTEVAEIYFTPDDDIVPRRDRSP